MQRLRPPSTARTPASGARPRGVTFPDLVRAHRSWEQELYGTALYDRKPDRRLEQEFHRRWDQFEGKYGQIHTVYWSVRDASAVAFSIKDKPRRFRRDELIPRFHRATDRATRDEPEVAEALDDCETLAARAEEILRGPSELIALRRINAVASHLLGFVDREWGRDPAPPVGPPKPNWAHHAECKQFVDHQREGARQHRALLPTDRERPGEDPVLLGNGDRADSDRCRHGRDCCGRRGLSTDSTAGHRITGARSSSSSSASWRAHSARSSACSRAWRRS